MIRLEGFVTGRCLTVARWSVAAILMLAPTMAHAIAVDPAAGKAIASPMSSASAARGADFTIQDLETNHILSLHADRADGTGPHPGPGAPWVDLVGTHDGALWEFLDNPASGWRGDGTLASPHRLECDGEDPLVPNRVTIPAASVPELQTIAPVAVAMWFKTGFDGPLDRYEYLLEWVEPPVSGGGAEGEGHGMSIAVQNGHLLVYQNEWVDGGALAPDTWYHVVVDKAPGDLRIYLDGNRTYTGNHPHMGVQQSEITLGASTFRVFEGFSGAAIYGDYFSGSIASADLWSRNLDDTEVAALYLVDRALYPIAPTVPTPTPLVILRADQANGAGPYPRPGAASPWVDVQGTATNAGLHDFAGDASSGWLGIGSVANPYRLQFDGIDDVATIDAGSIAELQTADAETAELWFQSGSDVESETYRYQLEWLQGFGATPGLSIAIAGGNLLVYLGNPLWAEVAPVQSNTWYHVVVAKQPGQVRVYLNGVRVYTDDQPNLGHQTTEVVIGGSIWRGTGNYGDFFDGAIARVTLWLGALNDAQANAAYLAGEAVFPYHLEIRTVGQGTVARNPDQSGYEHGAVVQLTATPDVGFTFSGWTGNASGNANPLSVTMNGNKSVTATFSAVGAAGDRSIEELGITALGPNPVRSVLRVHYALPFSGRVRLGLFDLQGREIARLAEGAQVAGRHEARWEAKRGAVDAPAGVYFLRLEAGGREVVRRVVLAR